MLPNDLDDLRRRLIVGGAAVTSIVYLLLLRFEPPRASMECVLALFVVTLFLLLLWAAYP